MADFTVENHAQVRHHKPPFWCAACDIGQSIPRCWLCAEPCQPTRGGPAKADGSDIYQPGTSAARSMQSVYVWQTEDVPDGTPVGVTAAIEHYDGR